MSRVEKTVFLSYRRTNAPWALAISQNLTHHGYDVFFDFNGIASGDFESVIIGNIRARAHFLVLLTPSALERCGDSGDWLRLEIESAFENKRNIVPLMLEGFDFSTPTIANQLTGTLAPLKRYNALSVPVEYFDAAMERLRTKYLTITLDAVLHPASPTAAEVAKKEQAAAAAAPAVTERQLTAQEWFERGFNATDLDEQTRCYSEAIRLKPDFPEAVNNRGNARYDKGDLEGALKDYSEVIRLKPDFADAFYNRGNARKAKGDLEGALRDYNEAIRFKHDYANAFVARGNARKAKGDLEGALRDYNEAIRFQPDNFYAFTGRGSGRRSKGDLDGALTDYNEAIRLKPDYANAYYNRALVWKQKNNPAAAIADFQKYLDLGGGERDGDTEEVEQMIRELRQDYSL